MGLRLGGKRQRVPPPGSPLLKGRQKERGGKEIKSKQKHLLSKK